MSDLDHAIHARRASRWLLDLELTTEIHEKVWRERLAVDDRKFPFTRLEREGLMVVAEMRKELH